MGNVIISQTKFRSSGGTCMVCVLIRQNAAVRAGERRVSMARSSTRGDDVARHERRTSVSDRSRLQLSPQSEL